MDIYSTVEECKNSTSTYYDYIKYKTHYNVVDSWDEITEKIIDTYTEVGRRVMQKNNSISELSKFETLLNSIQSQMYKQSKEAVKNSLYYMYHKYGMAYYVRIRDNKVNLFCYIWNNNYKNSLSEYMHIDPKHAAHYTSQDKAKWRINGAMIRVYEKHYQGYGMDFYYSETKYLLTKLCELRKITDCDFIVFGKDMLAIKKDLTEASEEVVGSISAKLPDKFKFDEYCPIFSFNWNNRYIDIPLPTPDDILRIFDICVPSKCQKIYKKLPICEWNSKKPTAVFRGSFTGASADIKRNPRLHIAYLSNKWKYNPIYNEKNTIDGIPYLDAGLSSKGGHVRGRKEINDKYIRFVDRNYWPHILTNSLTHEQQSNYKYILYIEGNASAYRGAYLFSFGSVVLWVSSSKYHLWFEPYLENHTNCIFIDHDLGNLATTIEWLKKNDSKAKKIAETGVAFYNKVLSKESILNYTALAINKICAN